LYNFLQSKGAIVKARLWSGYHLVTLVLTNRGHIK